MKVLLLSLFIAISYFSYAKIETPNLLKDGSQLDEVLYLPKKSAVELVSFGFDNFVSDLLWFKTISYFGKHYRGDKNYRWLVNMCELVNELQPKKQEVYEFCALMFAWEINDSKEAIKVLDRGIKNNPDYWRNYYLAGMVSAIFDKNEQTTKEYFIKSSKAPEAPLFVTRLAAKKLANLDDPVNAVIFLQDLVANASDKTQREALEEQLGKTIHEIKIKKLEQKLENYKLENNNSTPNSLNELPGITKEDLLDPWGGNYYIDKDKLVINSTSHKDRILLFDKKNE